MKTQLTQLSLILDYLNQESGINKVKERLETTYEWLRCKLSRASEPDELKRLETNSNHPEVQAKWRLIIEEAIQEDDLFYNELKVRLQEAVQWIEEKDPGWTQKHLEKGKKMALQTN
ncbi:hypothetical protein [Cyclobacterium plantarum]|uniref:hypothetical protein n=1 Tax=Cyclobacterium plantarum TaxID=2716263 RepID=UPI003F71237F